VQLPFRKIARKGVESAQKNVTFTQTRFERGLTNELDVTLAKRELAEVQAVLPELRRRFQPPKAGCPCCSGSTRLISYRSCAFPQAWRMFHSACGPGYCLNCFAGVPISGRPNAPWPRRWKEIDSRKQGEAPPFEHPAAAVSFAIAMSAFTMAKAVAASMFTPAWLGPKWAAVWRAAMWDRSRTSPG
jgi:hypothetical protein